ncbi:transporter substrate-binding domain-containing protein [Pantoea sp. GM01]|uniref:transporter substrate-binding domain-containing protein n=1 Tax=Pantoea sp. GM01 TaxID=1144320 RepID=UPI00027125D0|nr:transporter substrate-binding domain-containing protein [Pantoea sp. GM01]EJL85165.1 signal transduction histidine kinase [Pantoea sp. GM01]
MTRLFTLILCLFALLPLTCVQADDTYPTRLHSREILAPFNFNISGEAWRWLGEKRELRIAVYAPDNVPLSYEPEKGSLEGISADYLLLITRSLGVKAAVRHYPSRAEALSALHSGAIDMMVDESGSKLSPTQQQFASIPFINNQPSLISRDISVVLAPDKQDKGPVKIAMIDGYLDNQWVADHFPQAIITRYPSMQTALASVAFGENQYAIASLVSANWHLERIYGNHLSVTDIYPATPDGPRFLVNDRNAPLLAILNSAIQAVPKIQKLLIASQWKVDSEFGNFQSLKNLSQREQRWLQQHQTLNVVINPLYAPFTMQDSANSFYGVSADLLRLIRLRTGLNFNVIEANSVVDMFNEVKQGNADIIAAMSHSDARDNQLLFSRTYVAPPFVLVARDGSDVSDKLKKDMRIAVLPDNAIREWLKQHYPDVQQVAAPNASVALQWVNEGKVDGAVHNLIGASYMIDRFFRGELKILGRVGAKVSLISFAVSRNQPELHSILNKALADIPPREISFILKKWQSPPNARLDTWQLYRTQFYWMASIFALLVLSSLMWIYYLRREIGSRKRIELTLQDQANFHETLFNGTPVPVYVVDQSGEITDSNQAWRDFFANSSDALLALPLTDTQHPLAPIYPELQQLLSSPFSAVISSQRHIIRVDIQNHTIVHQAVPYRDRHGNVGGLICSWQDISGHEYLLDALSVARERAEKANRSKSTFLATMSHEIRTPISAIIGLLELAVTGKDKRAADDEAVRVAYDSAQSLLGLIGDILDMAKIESGKLELHPEWVDFSQLAEPVMRVFEGLARQKGLMLHCSVDRLHPDEILLDPGRFRQVLSNLVSNAIKFTERGSVDVEIRCLPEGEDKIRLEVRVTDTGIGISEEDQTRVFSPYEQTDAGAKKTTGTGLGLAICQELMLKMDGSIRLQSQLGRGSCITIQVPVKHRQHLELPNAEPSPQPDIPVSLRILAVDDHPANRLLLKRQLTRQGHQVIEAVNGEQALELWRKMPFDVVITDCSMPVMDGLTLTRIIRTEETSPITILGLTANAQEEERLRCLAAGMNDCLFKPLRLPQLEAVLRHIPGQSPSEEEWQPRLEEMIDLEMLRALAHGEREFLFSLLRATRDENVMDMQQAEKMFSQHLWDELARSLHRMAGAAQIIGANGVEQYCRELEKAFLHDPTHPGLSVKFHQTLTIIEELNQAIDIFIAADQVA